MARFIWFIIDLTNGSVTGTNDTEELQKSGLADTGDFAIIHRETGTFYFDSSDTNREIPEHEFGADEGGMEAEVDDDEDGE